MSVLHRVSIGDLFARRVLPPSWPAIVAAAIAIVAGAIDTISFFALAGEVCDVALCGVDGSAADAGWERTADAVSTLVVVVLARPCANAQGCAAVIAAVRTVCVVACR